MRNERNKMKEEGKKKRENKETSQRTKRVGTAESLWSRAVGRREKKRRGRAAERAATNQKYDESCAIRPRLGLASARLESRIERKLR